MVTILPSMSKLLVISIALLVGCSTDKNVLTENLVCQLSSLNKQGCTPVLSLVSGELKFEETTQRFELNAHYDACHQVQDVIITGEYMQRTHKQVYDLELLATKVAIKNGKEANFPRTIGLISLNIATHKGHFTDVWAMIREQGQKQDNLFKVDVDCQLKPVQSDK